MVFLGYGILGGEDEESPPVGALPRLVAKLNGPPGFIYQVDANGLTDVDIRFNGFITLPTFNPAGGPGDFLRYYKDPVDTTGALLNEAVDPAWSMDLHRGNDFIDLGLFHINDPPITGTSGTLSATQAGNTLSATAKVIVKGSMSAVQAAHMLTGFGEEDTFGGTLVASQAGNFMSAAGKVRIRGTLNVVQSSNFISAQGTPPIESGVLVLDEINIGPYLDGRVVLDGSLSGEASIGPHLEGAVL